MAELQGLRGAGEPLCHGAASSHPCKGAQPCLGSQGTGTPSLGAQRAGTSHAQKNSPVLGGRMRAQGPAAPICSQRQPGAQPGPALGWMRPLPSSRTGRRSLVGWWPPRRPPSCSAMHSPGPPARPLDPQLAGPGEGGTDSQAAAAPSQCPRAPRAAPQEPGVPPPAARGWQPQHGKTSPGAAEQRPQPTTNPAQSCCPVGSCRAAGGRGLCGAAPLELHLPTADCRAWGSWGQLGPWGAPSTAWLCFQPGAGDPRTPREEGAATPGQL